MLKTMQFNNETFKEIPGYNGRYFISKNGKVISTLFDKVKELKLTKNNDGYLFVNLSDGNKSKLNFIHRLLMLTYVLESTEWPKGMVTDHLNGDKSDNRLENLELVTNQENLRRAFDKGGYINRYIPVKARNWETKEVILFESCNACEKHIGICKDLITGSGRMDNPHKVYPEGWQYCRPDQEFPNEGLIFLTEKERPVSVKNILTTQEYDFNTLSDAAEYLNLPLSTLWLWLSKEEQPFVPDSHLVKFRDNPNPWRLVLDPLKELIDKKTELEPILVYNENEKPMLFLSVSDAGRFFNVGKTTISYRCRNKLDVMGYKWLFYRDWVVLKPFELRGPLAKYFVPTQDSDILGGNSNQADTVKSKVIEKIRSQDSAFEQLPRSKIDSVIRRRIKQQFYKMDSERMPDYWNDFDTFFHDITHLPGYNEKDFYFGRIKLKLNVKKDGRVFNEYHSRENSIFVTVPEYIVE